MAFNTSTYYGETYHNTTVAENVWTDMFSAITVAGRYRIRIKVVARSASAVGTALSGSTCVSTRR